MRARLRLRCGIPHEPRDVAGRLLRAATLAFVAAALTLAVNQSRRDDDENRDVPPAAVLVDPLATELARCRTITPEQNAADDTCRRAWAESRRRFFAPSSSHSDAGTNAPVAAGTVKSQDRLSSTGAQSDRDEVR
jgi:conjugative transfer region protein TrbK